MTGRAANTRRWRVGELAEATGLTVRTLHHYERIGLLAPVRTDGRQRLYDESDVRRLYRIRALRDLGLSLTEIGRLLDHDRGGLPAVLRAHRARVDAELDRLGRLRQLLDYACKRAEGSVDPTKVLATIEAMSRVARRGPGPKDTEARWREIGDELRACMDAGLPPSSPRVRAVARKAQARIVAFAGGDPATLEALAHLRKLDPPPNLAGFTAALMRYLDRAMKTLTSEE